VYSLLNIFHTLVSIPVLSSVVIFLYIYKILTCLWAGYIPVCCICKSLFRYFSHSALCGYFIHYM